MRYNHHKLKFEKIMKTNDLRLEIIRLIQVLPENLLEDIFIYLSQIEKEPKENVEALSNLKRIFKEDQELLEKLAK